VYRAKINPKHGFFLTQTDGSVVNAEVINRRVKRLSDKFGIEITPHGLRRTCGTIWELKGLPPSLIKEGLGHSTIATTYESYIIPDKQKMIDWLRYGGRPVADTPATIDEEHKFD
jgi:integrase